MKKRPHLKFKKQDRKQPIKPWLHITLLSLAALLCIALLVDVSHFMKQPQGKQLFGPLRAPAAEIQQLEQLSRLQTYHDPQGAFSLQFPDHWTLFSGTYAQPHNIVVKGPNQTLLCVDVTPSEYGNFDPLLSEIKDIEQKTGVQSHIRTGPMAGIMSVQRTIQLHFQKTLLIDFLSGTRLHHLEFSAPTRLFDQYLPAILKLLDATYRAPAPDPSVSPT